MLDHSITIIILFPGGKKMSRLRVYPETPFDRDQVNSHGQASYMIFRKHDFPTNFYDERDELIKADSDRLLQLENANFRAQLEKHIGSGEMALPGFFEQASDEQIMAFLKDALQADAKIKWTGFRITVSVHRAHGYIFFHMTLFAKHPDSSTELCSGIPCRLYL